MFRRRFARNLHYCAGGLIIGLLMAVSAVAAQTTAFTYQGRLTDGGNPADAIYEMQFKLFDSADFVTGIQVGATITNLSVQVTNGRGQLVLRSIRGRGQHLFQ